MPMDIRAFFAKKPGGATAKVDNVAKVEGTANSGTKAKATATSTGKPKAVPVPAATSASKKQKERPENAKKMKGFESSDDEDHVKPSPKKKLKTANANKMDDSDSDDVQAISASDYFAKTAPSKRTSKATTNAETPAQKKKEETTSSAGKKRRSLDDDEDEKEIDYMPSSDGDDDDDYEEVKAKKPSPAKKRATPTKRTSSPASRSSPRRSPSPKKKTKAPSPPKTPILSPTLDKDSFNVDTDAVVPECLDGLTFCLTGNMENLHRDVASDLIKTLGGRVTNNVSGKTSFLVVGEVLEDGRPVEQSSKYRTAMEKKTPMVLGETKLYGLFHLYQNLAKKNAGIETTEPAKSVPPTAVAATAAAKPAPTVATDAKPAPMFNPYARKPTVNPYAKKPAVGASATSASTPVAAATNPYASKKNPYSKGPGTPSASAAPATTSSSAPNVVNQLWVDRHAPTSTRDILGNKENIIKLRAWLDNWERTFNNPKSYNKSFSSPNGPWKAALLSGPPGIGKTTTATLVAKEAGRDLREFNASDARSKKALQQQLGDLTGSQSLGFIKKDAKNPTHNNKNKKQLRCIIMDEVDGMGAGDRSGMAELIQMIKKSKVPIICICNDRQSQKMKSLLPYCMDLRFRRPVKSVMANRAIHIAQQEGLKVERNAAEAIAESCGNDVRQVLNVLQMWAQKKEDLTFKTLKDRENSINKDEILRVSLFDAARTILEGRKGLSGADGKVQCDSLSRRSDAFFVDYSFTGLLVQQNYPKILQPQYMLVKKADNAAAEVTFLNRMSDAAASMSDYAVVEHEIRSGDQNWSLLPTCGMMTVKTGFHAGGKTGGNLNGYPEFTAWMGKNSSKGKKQRLLNELHHHMNYKISADSQQLRESYLPVLRERFMTLFKEDSNEAATDEAIRIMDEYGLSREDVMEKLDEFQLAKKGEITLFADLDSKQKAAFTRRYNQGSHTSQALVQEEFGTSKPKRGASKREKDPLDLDAIDEDVVDDDESEGEDEEAELRKLQEKLKKGKGRKAAAAKPAAKASAGGKKGRKK